MLDEVHFDYFKKSAKHQADNSKYLKVQTSISKHEEEVMKLKKTKLQNEVAQSAVLKDISLLQRRKLELEVFSLETQLGM